LRHKITCVVLTAYPAINWQITLRSWKIGVLVSGFVEILFSLSSSSISFFSSIFSLSSCSNETSRNTMLSSWISRLTRGDWTLSSFLFLILYRLPVAACQSLTFFFQRILNSDNTRYHRLQLSAFCLKYMSCLHTKRSYTLKLWGVE